MKMIKSRFSMKKGQTAGQVLVYAMSIILVSLILVFGYKAIDMFVGQSEQVAKVKFAADFESLLRRMDYGDVEIQTFTIPSEYKMICLASNFEGEPKIADEMQVGRDPGSGEINPLMKAEWLETDNNVFLISGIDSFYAFKVRKLHLDKNGNGQDDDHDVNNLMSHLCIPTNGKFTLRMESMGKWIFISSKVAQQAE